MTREGGTSRREFLGALGGLAVVTGAMGCGSACGPSGRGGGRRANAPHGSAGPAAGSGESAGGGTPGSQAGTPGGTAAPGTPPARPRVVVVRAKRPLRDGYDADPGTLRSMLDAGLRALTGEPEPVRAIRRFVRPSDTVGLKVNCLAGRQAATHVELVDELSRLLGAAGLPPGRQIVFDRTGADLLSARFPVGEGKLYACQGNDELGYEEEPTLMPSSASRLCRLLTEKVTALINVPVLKQHMLSGMTGALKNHFGCIDNPNKMHLDGCDPYIAEVNALPRIRGTQRLVVMDALRPVVDMGPSYQPGMTEPCHAILLGTDPVAVDAVALDLLDGLRRKRGLPPVSGTSPGPAHIATAARLGLGVAARERIDVVNVEV